MYAHEIATLGANHGVIINQYQLILESILISKIQEIVIQISQVPNQFHFQICLHFGRPDLFVFAPILCILFIGWFFN